MRCGLSKLLRELLPYYMLAEDGMLFLPDAIQLVERLVPNGGLQRRAIPIRNKIDEKTGPTRAPTGRERCVCRGRTRSSIANKSAAQSGESPHFGRTSMVVVPTATEPAMPLATS